jgi:hypothetical protein
VTGATTPVRATLSARAASSTSAAALLIAAFALIVALGACETSAPELYELQWVLVDFDDRDLDRRYERLSVFVRAADADGLEDLEELYVIHDGGELFWRTTADTWTRDERDDATWIGAASLAMPGEQPFPAGEYRVLLIDAGGERDTSRFLIPEQRNATPLPEVRQSGGTFAVSGEADYNLWIVSEGVLRESVAAGGEVDLAGDEYRSGIRYEVYVFGKLPDADKGALSGPYFWQPE